MDFLEYPEIMKEEKGGMIPGRLKLTNQTIIFKNNKTGKVDQIQASEIESIKWQRLAAAQGLHIMLQGGIMYRFAGFADTKIRKLVRRSNLFEELDDYEFQRRFRLTKSVTELTLLIEEKLESKTPCNNALNPLEQVLIALRFYAVACMQLAIADLFDVSQPTVCRVVHRVSEAIASLLPDFIHLPVNTEECKTVSRKFFSIAAFPKVIGALDGTFVRIVNVVARWPGSAHDSTVFNNSAACLSLKTNALFQDFHLLGDTGYACEKSLLTPFGNPRSLSEARYNKSHVLTRNTIERKYGMFKRRFPYLSIGLNCHIDRVPSIVVFFTTYVYAWRILNHLQIPR
ncbi:putative nuclease HARBI1 [Trichonephila clavipes]|nr:putative nuclease HARBI1 [Trichonephila clavipes]